MNPSTVFLACVLSAIALLCVLGAVSAFFGQCTDPVTAVLLATGTLCLACMALNEVRREFRDRKRPRGFEVMTEKDGPKH